MTKPRMTVEEYRALQGKQNGKKRGEVNKTEGDFERDELAPLKLSGVVVDYKYESVKFRLANGAWYTPDFVAWVHGKQRPMVYEIKGFWREAARVRIKVAAELYPQYQFIAVQKKRKKDGGGWEYEWF